MDVLIPLIMAFTDTFTPVCVGQGLASRLTCMSCSREEFMPDGLYASRGDIVTPVTQTDESSCDGQYASGGDSVTQKTGDAQISSVTHQTLGAVCRPRF